MIENNNGRLILASHYFIYFGVMGVYLPFFNLYCFEIGLHEWQIGALTATRAVVLILFSIFWSLMADRRQSRRPIYIICNFASAALWSLFFLTAQFKWMLVITIIYGAFFAPIIAFLEAFAMDYLGADKKRYGSMRAWGSVAFIAVVTLLGRVIDHFGVDLILALVLIGSSILSLVSLLTPRVHTRRPGLSGRSWRQLIKPGLLFFWSSAFLMLVSHGAYYTFFSIHLTKMGYGKDIVGLCWALASCGEIVVMLNSERFFKRFSYEAILVATFAVAAFRWTGLYLTQSLWLILALQLTHAITYGAFHMAGILYTDLHASAENKTLAQSVNNVVTYGLGMMVGSFLSGFIYGKSDAKTMFLVSAATAVAGGALFSIYLLTSGKRAPQL